MPFPLTHSDDEIAGILSDPKHIAYPAVSAQDATRKLYRQNFYEAEQELARKGTPLAHGIAQALNSTASRIFAAAEDLASADGQREARTFEMVRLAFGLVGEEAKAYIEDIKDKMNNALTDSAPT